MLSELHFRHVMVYPAPPFVVLWHFWLLPFLLLQTGQSCLLQLADSVGESLLTSTLGTLHLVQQSSVVPILRSVLSLLLLFAGG